MQSPFVYGVDELHFIIVFIDVESQNIVRYRLTTKLKKGFNP